VQWVGVTESPPLRRYRIATLTVATAAGAARVVDLDREEALGLQRALVASASAAGAWLPDAV
jgi:membrane protein YdbS with pleckstrin-like domain